MSFLARANRAFKYELVSCVRAKHLIGFVHLSPFARRLLRLALTTRSKDERRQNTDQPNSCSGAVEKMRTGVRERRASGPESLVGHQIAIHCQLLGFSLRFLVHRAQLCSPVVKSFPEVAPAPCSPRK